jgi:pimeloyl-ACP methyl ester carboxylesterase
MPLVTVGSNTIHWERHGAQNGRTPAVLIMGLGTDAHGWERQLPALGADRPIVTLDNRGVGRSAKPPGPYTTAELADDVAAVMDAADLDEAHVVGLSLGGMIAQELALRHARRVRSLALVATYAKPGRETRETADRGARTAGGLDVGSMLEAMSAGPIVIDPKQVMAFLMPLVFTADFIEREKPFLKEFYERSLAYGFSPQAFAGQVAAVMAHDTIDRLATIEAPTIVITGTRDRLVRPHHSRTLAERIPGARLVEIEGGTHGLNFERAETLNEILSGWLRERDRLSA